MLGSVRQPDTQFYVSPCYPMLGSVKQSGTQFHVSPPPPTIQC